MSVATGTGSIWYREEELDEDRLVEAVDLYKATPRRCTRLARGTNEPDQGDVGAPAGGDAAGERGYDQIAWESRRAALFGSRQVRQLYWALGKSSGQNLPIFNDSN